MIAYIERPPPFQSRSDYYCHGDTFLLAVLTFKQFSRIAVAISGHRRWKDAYRKNGLGHTEQRKISALRRWGCFSYVNSNRVCTAPHARSNTVLRYRLYVCNTYSTDPRMYAYTTINLITKKQVSMGSSLSTSISRAIRKNARHKRRFF